MKYIDHNCLDYQFDWLLEMLKFISSQFTSLSIYSFNSDKLLRIIILIFNAWPDLQLGIRSRANRWLKTYRRRNPLPCQVVWLWPRVKYLGTTQAYDQLQRQNPTMGKVQTKTAQPPPKLLNYGQTRPWTIKKQKSHKNRVALYRGHLQSLNSISKLQANHPAWPQRQNPWTWGWIKSENCQPIR